MELSPEKLQEYEILFENEDFQGWLEHEDGYEDMDWDDVPEDEQEILKDRWFEVFVRDMIEYELA